jgi:hypothetical protein
MKIEITKAEMKKVLENREPDWDRMRRDRIMFLAHVIRGIVITAAITRARARHRVYAQGTALALRQTFGRARD